MAEELRALHNRMGATTVYVTHDQLEAMQMGDKIVVMNNSVVEQFGTPREIYDKPATMFVADFIGSPSMNLLHFSGAVAKGDKKLEMNGHSFKVPQMREGKSGDLAFGIRPEHILLSTNGGYRGEVIATEYLGTTQIVTLNTTSGELKARIDASQIAKIGETVGLEFVGEHASIFDRSSGKVIPSALHDGGVQNG